jgi:hypothetical protein
MPDPQPPQHVPASDFTVCNRCGQAVVWTVTAAGARQPVDPAENLAGNVAVYADATGRYRSRAITRERPTLEHAEWRAMPHAATCTAPAPRGRRAAGPRPARRTWRPRP